MCSLAELSETARLAGVSAVVAPNAHGCDTSEDRHPHTRSGAAAVFRPQRSPSPYAHTGTDAEDW